MVLLKTMQQMAPDTLEKFLLKEIRYAEEQGQEEHLLNCVRQAILFHTPGLRQVLLDLLRTRRFALYQEIEENILRVLDRNQTVQTVRLLDDMIHSPQTDIALRASTVWLLGSIKRPEALTLLSTILTSRSRFLRKHRYSKEMRLQAIDTLRHFQWDNLTELLDKVKKDGDREVRQYAEQMLEAERGFTFM
jgi:HEAT repeat protein